MWPRKGWGSPPWRCAQHLYALETGGDAVYAEEARPRGRRSSCARYPGRRRPFCDSHSSLATDLIVQMKKAFGDEGLDKLLKLAQCRSEKAYRAKTDKGRP